MEKIAHCPVYENVHSRAGDNDVIECLVVNIFDVSNVRGIQQKP